MLIHRPENRIFVAELHNPFWYILSHPILDIFIWTTAGIVTIFLVSLIVPLLILIICYSSVYCLIRSIQNDVNGVGERNSGNRHVARNTLNNIAILVLCYVVCWLPFHIYMLLNSIGFDVSKFKLL